MKKIGMPLLPESKGLVDMLNTIGRAFDVQFKQHSYENEAEVDAWFIHKADREAVRQISISKRPCFVIIRGDNLRACGNTSTIEFSNNSAVPSILHGRRIRVDEAINLKALPEWLHGISILASKEKAPVWAIYESGGRYHHYVSTSIPELKEGEPLFQYFHGKQFLRLLPFLLFLRSLDEDEDWEQPPLQACFMFDDPNLHWSKYGFIDFAKMAKHAELYNYHVAFATIPLDAWFIHKPTARLFKEHSNRLSLLIHGNDHVAGELAKPYFDKKNNRILSQALCRIARLERRSGLKVSRVLAPPHGACNESFLGEMARLHFEAACISNGSLRRHNSQAKWLRTVGMEPANIIRGLPVFPRFPLSQNSYNSILIAALLGQPIIPVGHHQDVSEGLEILGELSQFINSLGNVIWADMAQIAKMHYSRKIEGDILSLKLFTKHIEIQVPEGVYRLLVNRSRLKEEAFEPLAWRSLKEGASWNIQSSEGFITVVPGQRIEINSVFVKSINNNIKCFRRPNIWPVTRRLLTEARDRIAPSLKRTHLL